MNRTPDQVNEFLFLRGLRPCPHSHHSHDEEFAECARTKGTNMPFTEDDHKFLRAMGVDPGPTPDETRLCYATRWNREVEPLDGEIEAELPAMQCPSGGQCDEPSYTTISGIPICSRCSRSTRSMNQLVCAPCRSRTRLLLTKADRNWLRQIGIAR